jgi:hypothetical protein
MSTNPLPQNEQAALLEIAMKHIYPMKERGTFEARYRDKDDFIDVAVWNLELALTEAYLLGKQAAK